MKNYTPHFLDFSLFTKLGEGWDEIPSWLESKTFSIVDIYTDLELG